MEEKKKTVERKTKRNESERKEMKEYTQKTINK